MGLNQPTISVSYPAIKDVKLTITTNSGKKDPSTWLSAELICNGQVIADYLDKGSLIRQNSKDPLQLYVKHQQQLDPKNTRCELKFELSGTYQKYWNFDSYLVLNLSDGLPRTYYLNWKLTKTKSREIQALPLQ